MRQNPGSGFEGKPGFGTALPYNPCRPFETNCLSVKMNIRGQAFMGREADPDAMFGVIEHNAFAPVPGIIGDHDFTVHFGPFLPSEVLLVGTGCNWGCSDLKRTLNPSQIGTVRLFCPKEARFHTHGVV